MPPRCSDGRSRLAVTVAAGWGKQRLDVLLCSTTAPGGL